MILWKSTEDNSLLLLVVTLKKYRFNKFYKDTYKWTFKTINLFTLAFGEEMMKLLKILFVILFSTMLASCGGGGSSGASASGNGGGGGVSKTAAEYFTKTAVGNTWTWSELPSGTTTKDTITASAGGVVTITHPKGVTTTSHLDGTGALVSTTDSTSVMGTITNALTLPATFSVGTTWTVKPATATDSAVKATVIAIDVTRTVSAGTFNDCLQVDQTYTTSGTTVNATSYYSPTAGADVFTSVTFGTTAFSRQLLAGYIANSSLFITSFTPGGGPVGTTVTINGTDFSATPNSNIVKFNGTQATVTNATTKQLVVTVPAGATSGKISVTVNGKTATSATDYAVTTSGGGGGGEGTAAYYFTKTAVGNTWNSAGTTTVTPTGFPVINITHTSTNKITASANGVVTYTYTDTSTQAGSPPTTSTNTSTTYIDSAGALVSNDGTSTYIALPPTFTVGTTWDQSPPNTNGIVSSIGKIIAFNVTRTVPAGTFTDCLQIESTEKFTDGSTSSYTTYVSPTISNSVESMGSSVSSGGTSTYADKLQSYTIAP